MIDYKALTELYEKGRISPTTTGIIILLLNITSAGTQLFRVDLLAHPWSLFLINALLSFFFLLWGLPVANYKALGDDKLRTIKNKLGIKNPDLVDNAHNHVVQYSDGLRHLFLLWTILYLILMFIEMLSACNTIGGDFQILKWIPYSNDLCGRVIVPNLVNLVNAITSVVLIRMYRVLHFDLGSSMKSWSVSWIYIIGFVYVAYAFLLLVADLSPSNYVVIDTMNFTVTMIFGIISCITFSFILARLESKFTRPKLVLITGLFIYAALQMVYPITLTWSDMDLFSVTNEFGRHMTIALLIYAFLGKSMFYFLSYSLITKHDLFIYFIRIGQEDNSHKKIVDVKAIINE